MRMDICLSVVCFVVVLFIGDVDGPQLLEKKRFVTITVWAPFASTGTASVFTFVSLATIHFLLCCTYSVVHDWVGLICLFQLFPRVFRPLVRVCPVSQKTFRSAPLSMMFSFRVFSQSAVPFDELLSTAHFCSRSLVFPSNLLTPLTHRLFALVCLFLNGAMYRSLSPLVPLASYLLPTHGGLRFAVCLIVLQGTWQRSRTCIDS